jgi:hypothetical protein
MFLPSYQRPKLCKAEVNLLRKQTVVQVVKESFVLYAHRIQATIPVLSQMNAVYTLISCFFKQTPVLLISSCQSKTKSLKNNNPLREGRSCRF